MTPEERALEVCCKPGRGVLHASDMSPLPNDRRMNLVYQVYPSEVAEAIAAARFQAFEEAAKMAERHLPAGMYPEALAGAIAAAIRQHAKGDGK